MANLAALSHRLLDEVWNKKNLDVVDELIAPQFVVHDPQGTSPRPGPEGYKEYVHAYLTAFPDFELTIDDQVADESTVATRWSCSGTHRGQLLGVPPTGRRVTVTGTSFSKFSDGKFAESWSSWDQLSLMQQLGVMPSGEVVQAA